MGVERNILFSFPGRIHEVAEAVNRVLDLEKPLRVETHTAECFGSWWIATGYLGDDVLGPVTLMDADDFDFEDPTVDELQWDLGFRCVYRGEPHAAWTMRCTDRARQLMLELGQGLGTRCVLLFDLQTELGRYPEDWNSG